MPKLTKKRPNPMKLAAKEIDSHAKCKRCERFSAEDLALLTMTVELGTDSRDGKNVMAITALGRTRYWKDAKLEELLRTCSVFYAAKFKKPIKKKS